MLGIKSRGWLVNVILVLSGYELRFAKADSRVIQWFSSGVVTGLVTQRVVALEDADEDEVRYDRYDAEDRSDQLSLSRLRRPISISSSSTRFPVLKEMTWPRSTNVYSQRLALSCC